MVFLGCYVNFGDNRKCNSIQFDEQQKIDFLKEFMNLMARDAMICYMFQNVRKYLRDFPSQLNTIILCFTRRTINIYSN